MTRRMRRPDVLVIGGGLAGMTAALAARREGARVTLVAEGVGALELSSGCVDRQACPDDLLGPEHPYRLLGREALDEALAEFRRELAGAGWPMSAPPDGQNQRVVTALGTRRPTFLTPPGMAAPPPGMPVWVVGFPALRTFRPCVVAAGLGQKIPWRWVELPDVIHEIHPVLLARRMEDPDYLDAVIRRVAFARPPEFRQGDRPAALLVPAVLGLTRALQVQAAFAAVLDGPVVEVLMPPPSVPGLRLAEFLRRAVQRAGVDLVLGARVVSSRVEGGRVTAVVAAGPGGETTYAAGAFVLASGGLLGNGLISEGLSVREPVLGLPVRTPSGSEPADWADESFLPAGGHPFVRIGVPVDSTLRPPGFQNLFVCGRTLAGYDPYAEGTGGGVAVATGHVAGRLAAKAAGGEA